MKEAGLVKVWLKAGAIFSDGVLLFRQLFGDGHPLLLLLKSETPEGSAVLKSTLKSWYLRNKGEVKEDYKSYIIKMLEQAQLAAVNQELTDSQPLEPKIKLREDFPFLSELDCPHELKILAADKITAYHNYVSGHEKLFDCTSPHEQFAAAKFVTENYIENRRIYKELEHFKKTRIILGKHPIFDRLRRFRLLSKLNVIELIKLKTKLDHNIWRTKDQIKKGNKPHLKLERERMIRQKEEEILEITRLLAKYN